MSEWRLVIDDALEGAQNMARDRAIQSARARGEVPPTLRLYRWVRPTVTLGKFQRLERLDLDACARLGVDVVRRSTGGRGVLHDDELTYSVVVSTDDGVPRGVAASYRYLSEALASAYRALGIAAEITSHDGRSQSSACYLANTRADLSFGAAKLSGSAQVWDGDVVLQHGSFTRSRDVGREVEVFMLDPAEAEALERDAATMEGLLGRSPSDDEISEAVVSAFEATLGMTLRLSTLTARELQDADETYGHFTLGNVAR